MTPNFELAMNVFNQALEYIECAGLTSEVDWQRSRCFTEFNERDFLKEAAWVILCSGFKEAIIRRSFDHISLSFCDWESAASIVHSAAVCKMTALESFGNVRKIEAIINVARRVNDEGFDSIKAKVLKAPIIELQTLPFIGPITSWHLAKNLGLCIAKPDRHLLKLSKWLGYGEDVQKLCVAIAESTGELVNVVDIVLWRYVADQNPRDATDTKYIQLAGTQY